MHNHTLSAAIELPSTAIELASGCCATGYAGEGTYAFNAVAENAPVNLPFVLLPMCVQTA